jgi:hypothetical protein
MTDSFDLENTDELARKHVEETDFEGDTEHAAELLEELLALWDDLDRTGRIVRMRKARDTLDELIRMNQTRVRLELDGRRICPACEEETDEKNCPECDADTAKPCPDCGSIEVSTEDIGHGKRRAYCVNCDYTLSV